MLMSLQASVQITLKSFLSLGLVPENSRKEKDTLFLLKNELIWHMWHTVKMSYNHLIIWVKKCQIKGKGFIQLN